jgi:hypothetical protein
MEATTIYNSLMPIEDASAILADPDLPSALSELANVILRHRLSDVFGIRLLHAHNRVFQGERMIELEEHRLGHPCLTTVATNSYANVLPHAPSIWLRYSELHSWFY